VELTTCSSLKLKTQDLDYKCGSAWDLGSAVAGDRTGHRHDTSAACTDERCAAE